MTTKTKGRAGWNQATPKTTDRQNHITAKLLIGFFNLQQKRLSHAIWRTAYALEESRQNHASTGHLWRQALCCIALSLFRLIGGRI